MRFSIDSAIFGKFPGLNVGLVVAKGIDNKGMDEEIIRLIKEKQEEIRNDFSTETLSENPKIDAWRKAYSSFGAKPKKYKCSVENLCRMVLQGIDLKHFSKLVDAYNYISIKHLVPAGGDDIDKVDGDIVLTIAKGDEPFVELGSDETKSPRAGEVIYKDEKEVLCRRWNWRECDKSKMTDETRNAVLVIEGLPPFSREEVEEAIGELGEMIRKHCGGEIKTFILNESLPEAEI